ncbi:unnamed protein product [Effrenium voratum]|nr:unnamed protein product [Effrenium voratum]|eukprot:CAMPEP_0181483564 /NCGR_PEP_ID=MMETSP1110-20121109/45493_1 /TAXON_ID=174948 /ORGANISM="Symbiodinium sp., Strain CCMP421" /LENGTH=329 /DNA_ID=CAMNT_0023609293 /DNA_START=73 /DNA_END=1062 /DNA_ORIENTATION=+
MSRLLLAGLVLAAAEDNATEVREDISSTRSTFWDTLEGIFGSTKKFVHVSVRRSHKMGLLDSFCLDEDLWGDDTVVSCDCCTDHLIGDPLSQSALVYNSGKEQAPAFERKADGSTHQVGMVNVWSLGGRIPAVLCDRGRLTCHCEDPVRGWAEFEPACRRGKPCEPPETVVEGVSNGYEEQAAKLQAALAKANASKADALLEADSAAVRCAFGDRVPLGSAFCEDFSVEQCERTYSRTKRGVHHVCEVDQKTFRHCGATLLTEAEAQQRTAEAMSWAVQNFYTPSLDWKVRTVNFTTRVVEEPLPAADLFQAHVHNRMEDQGTMEKLEE